MARLYGKTVFQSNSPIPLNEYGKGLSEKIDALSSAAQYKKELVCKARKRAMNAYQIQQSCFDFSANEILLNLEKNNKEQYSRLTDIAYKEGIRIEVLTQILGVVLRDQVLADVGKSAEEIVGERNTVYTIERNKTLILHTFNFNLYNYKQRIDYVEGITNF